MNCLIQRLLKRYWKWEYFKQRVSRAEDLHKSVVRNFNNRNVQSPFIENILGADQADMQLISKFNWLFRFLLCVIDIYSKYAWVIH